MKYNFITVNRSDDDDDDDDGVGGGVDDDDDEIICSMKSNIFKLQIGTTSGE